MKRLIILLILLIVLSLTIFLAGCKPDPSVLNPSEFKVLSIKDYYPEAQTAAKAWNSAAYLTEIVAAYGLRNNDQPLNIHFRFRTKEEPRMWFLVSIRSSSTQFEIHEESGEYSEDDVPTLPQDFEINSVPVDSLGALEIANKSGGGEFLAAHQDLHQMPLAILAREPVLYGIGELQWTVIFTAESLKSIHVTIDANTAEVLEVNISGEGSPSW